MIAFRMLCPTALGKASSNPFIDRVATPSPSGARVGGGEYPVTATVPDVSDNSLTIRLAPIESIGQQILDCQRQQHHNHEPGKQIQGLFPVAL